MSKMILPIIKKAMPVLMAKDIIGVQPMSRTIIPFYVQPEHKEDVPEGFLVVDIKWICWEIHEWLETQNPRKWRKADSNHGLLVYTRYIISEDLYTLLALRWT